MRSKGDKYRREQSFISTATNNDLLAGEVAKHYTTLSALIVDDQSADVFQSTYCRLTATYTGGDIIEQFREMYFATATNYELSGAEYSGMVIPFNDVITGE